MPLHKYRATFDQLYDKYHHRRYVSPDPLETLYLYDSPADQEVIGLLAACLAYGRVTQILRSVATVREALGPSPSRSIRDGLWKRRPELKTFRHRFASAENLASLLTGMQGVLAGQGSLGRCFSQAVHAGDETYLPALTGFVHQLRSAGAAAAGHLLCDPRDGSACKRLNLLLRWMVRRDAVDVGCWCGLDPRRLVIPLDTHMFRIGRTTGAISRRSANGAAAAEFTRAFARYWPDDPVRFDFSLTRPGIRGEETMAPLLKAAVK